MPMPYTPSPSHAQGTPLNTSFLALRFRKSPIDSSESGDALSVEAGTVITASDPRKYFTDCSALAVMPFDISHPGLCAKRIRSRSMSPAMAVMMNSRLGHGDALSHDLIRKKHAVATIAPPSDAEALAVPTMKSFHRLGISSDI